MRRALTLLPLLFVPALASAQTRPNLSADEVRAPAEAVAGTEVRLELGLESLGAPATTRYAVLLALGNVRAGAMELGRFGPEALPADTLVRRTVNVRLPAGLDGLRTFLVVVDPDDQVAESNENDNLAFAAAETSVRLPAAELAIESVSLSAARVAPGDALVVSFEVRNRGPMPSAALSADIVVGRDPVPTRTDRALGRTTIPAVGAGQSLATGARVELPANLAAGEWRIGLLLDPERRIGGVAADARARVALQSITVVRGELVLLTSNLPDGALERPYDLGFEARGGDGTYTFEIVGAVPDGLVLDAAGQRLRGTPRTTGTFPLEVAVLSDQRRDSVMTSLTVNPSGVDLAVATATLAEAFVGRTYLQNLAAGGGEPPYTWSTSDPLPPGLMLAPNGFITGVPEQLGLSRFQVQVRDRLGAERSATYTLLVSLTPEVLIRTATVAAAVGEPLDAQLSVIGGLPPIRWFAATPPPPGVELTPDGRLVGTPRLAGRWPMRVSATDATTPGVSDFAFVEVDVQDQGALRITSGPMSEIPRFVLFEHFLTADGGNPPYVWSLVPGDFLPPDFQLVPGPEREQPENTAVLYGQAVGGGLSAFTVRVEDTFGRRAEQPLVYFVQAAQTTTGGGGGGCRHLTERPGGRMPMLYLGLLGLLWRSRRRRFCGESPLVRSPEPPQG